MKITIITVSDRAYNKIYDDLSGPMIEKILKNNFSKIEIKKIIVPDEKESLLYALNQGLDSDFIITTGGTGISPRDITPDITKSFCDKELPGIAEILRVESYKETPMAMLSRGYAGIKENTIIVNFPGSVKAVKLCTKIFMQIMEHSLKMLQGLGH